MLRYTKKLFTQKTKGKDHLEDTLSVLLHVADLNRYRDVVGIIGMYSFLYSYTKKIKANGIRATLNEMSNILGMSPPRTKKNFDLLASWGFIHRIRTRDDIGNFGHSFIQVFYATGIEGVE